MKHVHVNWQVLGIYFTLYVMAAYANYFSETLIFTGFLSGWMMMEIAKKS